MIEISDQWKQTYPGAVVGVLVMREAANQVSHEGIDRLAQGIEDGLREKFAAAGKPALKSHPVIAAYDSYYKAFRKTYHVALQLESVIWKSRSIPSINAIVKAMFMAELSNMLLTAGHDMGKVALPLRLDVGRESESYIAMGGEERVVKEGDMRISDASGVISSIIGGPDERTSISLRTKDLLFTVYAPPGIGDAPVRSHLDDVRRFVKTIAPQAVTERAETHRAD